MRLLRLELENWSTHQSLGIDLSGGLQIEGRNGTGKSSILEAIRFIFKETARGYAGRIRNGCRSANVRLTFETEGVVYVVSKTLLLDKPSTALMLANGIQIADNPSNVHDRLEVLISEDVLDKLLYIPQNGLTAILERLSGRDGKLEMDRLFGLDKLEKVWEKTGLEVQEDEIKAKILQEELNRYPEKAEEQFNGQIIDFKSQIQAIRDRISGNRANLSGLMDKLSAVEQRSRALSELKRSIDSLFQTKASFEVAEAEAKKEIEAAEGRIKQLENRENELIQLESQKKGLANSGQIRQKLRSLKENESLSIQFSTLKIKKERLFAILEKLKEQPFIVNEKSALEKSIKRLESEYSVETANLKIVIDYKKQLTALDGQVNCPTCGQKLNSFIMERELRENQQKETSHLEKRKSIDSELKQLMEQSRGITEKAEHFKELEAESRHLSAEILEKEALSKELHARKDVLTSELDVLGYAEEDVKVIEGRYVEFIHIEGRIQSIMKEISEKKGLIERKNSFIQKRGEYASKNLEITEKLGKLKYNLDEADNISKERDSLADQSYKLKSDILNMESDGIRIENQINETLEKLKAYENIKSRVSDTQRLLELRKAARDIFHRDRGIVRYLREGFMNRLNGILMHHFKQFNENPKYLSVTFDKDYNLIIYTTNGNLAITQLSGGEMVQLALALRIALIDLISPIKLLVLDEPFGSLDEEHRELLGESLNIIAKQGQLILVTHVHVESLQLPNRLDLGGY